MNILLCGLPCCGKTTVGKLLATHLQMNHIDTDRMIEEAFFQENLSCRELFFRLGHEQFRAVEKGVIESLSLEKNSVISLGGGTLEAPQIAPLLQKLGLLIYLDAPLELLWKRIEERGLPAYLDPQNPYDSFIDLAHHRIPLYKDVSTVTIDSTNCSVEEVVAKIFTSV